MLAYESKPVLPPEPAWKLVASLCLGSLACASGLALWWRMAPGLWVLATFTPAGPIRPMGAVAGLFIFTIGGLISWVLFAMPAISMSTRRAAQIVGTLGGLACLLPLLNLVLFFVIIFARGIVLAG